jgi:hypothetical protein
MMSARRPFTRLRRVTVTALRIELKGPERPTPGTSG